LPPGGEGKKEIKGINPPQVQLEILSWADALQMCLGHEEIGRRGKKSHQKNAGDDCEEALPLDTAGGRSSGKVIDKQKKKNLFQYRKGKEGEQGKSISQRARRHLST